MLIHSGSHFTLSWTNLAFTLALLCNLNGLTIYLSSCLAKFSRSFILNFGSKIIEEV